MSPTSAFGHSCDEGSERANPGDHPVAGEAGLRACHSVVWYQYNGYQYPCTLVASPTLVEDARAVLNGDANHLLSNEEAPVDVDGPHGINQEIPNAVTPQATNIVVAPQANGPGTTPYVSLPQLPPQVPVAPVFPQVNNQVQHNTAPASRQCRYGCTETFGRPGEYRRHMKKHTGPFFPCLHAHCGKMFYRQDKLWDHLAQGH